MLDLVRCLVTILFASRAKLAAENLALRHQLSILGRSVKRPRLRKRDRIFWVWLSKLWPGWRTALVVVKPATVVAWHRKGFRLYWRWKSRRHGRPKIDAEVRALIRRMSMENPFWGAPRIQAELTMLGVDVADSTIAKYLVTKPSRPPSQTWRTFLANHLDCTAACDFFVVPTSTFGCFMPSSYSAIAGARSFTSTSRRIQRPCGRRNRSSKPFPVTAPNLTS